MKSTAGFTLVELMVATLVTTTGIVGSIAIQATAKKNTFDAQQRAQASALAHDMLERIRRNKSQLLSYSGMDFGKRDYTSITQCHSINSTPAPICTPDQLADYDQYQWNEALKGALVTKNAGNDLLGGLMNPTGCINIAQVVGANGANLTDAGQVNITISWSGRHELKDANNGSVVNDCGGADEDKSRRQVNLSALVY